VDHHHTSGLTSRLILSYAERAGGRAAVERILARCGLEDHEAQLRNENYWFDFETKIRLFEAASEILDDPDLAFHVGAAALDLNVAPGLKLALRALGSPRLVYANVVSASGKFTWAHRWEIVHLARERARVRYFDVSGVGYHRLDCQYNRGLLSRVPALFGMPPAEIMHASCALDGAEACVYELRWDERPRTARSLFALAGAMAATVGSAMLAAPALVPVAVAVPAATAALVSYTRLSSLRRTARSLRRELQDQQVASERLSASLQDLVADLRLDEVLAKITGHAQSAVGGKQFALLLCEGGRVRCGSSSGLPASSVRALEEWAGRSPKLFEAPLALDDLSGVPELATLPEDEAMPLGSLCAAPLVFRDERLGAVVALAHGPRAFLPHDAAVLRSYAAQAALAMSQARLVERLQARASRDALTDLLNHREFHAALGRELSRAERYGTSFCVVLLDLDGFKRINDEYGHARGDALLREAAIAIKSACRSSEIVCRIGGDEFGLVLPESNASEARVVASRIQSVLGALKPGMSASVGIVEWPADGHTTELLMFRADMALYSGKTNGVPRLVAGAPAESRERRKLEETRIQLVLDWLTGQACQSLGVDKAVISIRDGSDSDAVIAVAARGVPADLLRTHPLGDGLVGEVLRSGEPLVLEDYQQLERPPRAPASDLHAVVSVPLSWGATVHGALSVGSTDSARRFGPEQVRSLSELADVGAVALENLDLRAQVTQSVRAGAEAMALAVDARDSYTAQHSDRVVKLARHVGERLGLDLTALVELEYAARLHDLGKIAVRDEILHKAGKLDDEERELMRQHTLWGEAMLERIPGLEGVAKIVRSAHERWDGTGYPDGLAGQEIPLESRIVFVCDAYHAMTSDRTYRRALEHETAVRQLLSGAGSQFDPEVVGAFLDAVDEPGETAGGRRGFVTASRGGTGASAINPETPAKDDDR
jgi:diguanylate cyclase (GGDEF)-like protein